MREFVSPFGKLASTKRPIVHGLPRTANKPKICMEHSISISRVPNRSRDRIALFFHLPVSRQPLATRFRLLLAPSFPILLRRDKKLLIFRRHNSTRCRRGLRDNFRSLRCSIPEDNKGDTRGERSHIYIYRRFYGMPRNDAFVSPRCVFRSYIFPYSSDGK